MSQVKFIRPSNVKLYQAMPGYGSKMLLDCLNSHSQALHINQGVLEAGAALPGGDHRPPYDEVYIIQQGRCALEVGGDIMEIMAGDVIFIPGGTYHRLDNSQGKEDLILLTIWPGTPPAGVNPIYDSRMREWGKSYQSVDEE